MRPDIISLEATTIVIRETLMQYFKGTCIDSFAYAPNVMLHQVYGNHRYQYERQEAERIARAHLQLGRVRLFELTREPAKIVFHPNLLRSPQLLHIRKEIKRFMKQYLPNVEVVCEELDIVPNQDDSVLLDGAGALDKNETPKFHPMEYTISSFSDAYIPAVNVEDLPF